MFFQVTVKLCIHGQGLASIKLGVTGVIVLFIYTNASCNCLGGCGCVYNYQRPYQVSILGSNRHRYSRSSSSMSGSIISSSSSSSSSSSRMSGLVRTFYCNDTQCKNANSKHTAGQQQQQTANRQQ